MVLGLTVQGLQDEAQDFGFSFRISGDVAQADTASAVRV